MLTGDVSEQVTRLFDLVHKNQEDINTVKAFIRTLEARPASGPSSFAPTPFEAPSFALAPFPSKKKKASSSSSEDIEEKVPTPAFGGLPKVTPAFGGLPKVTPAFGGLPQLSNVAHLGSGVVPFSFGAAFPPPVPSALQSTTAAIFGLGGLQPSGGFSLPTLPTLSLPKALPKDTSSDSSSDGAPKKKPFQKAMPKGIAKGRKMKMKRDPNAPKKPKSAFLLFSLQERPKVITTQPGLKFSAIAQEIGRRWKALSAADKKVYFDLQQQEKTKYTQDLAAYNANANNY
eukprot:TRINITY_DN2762_c0_g1_i4.p1 TRINITY_DN2762_c0_g1~~TRINITY_DN2762_c0_g1_i4.p1  ORF type:complete len:287 (+),score=74.76 TRINITY_DN2762_c0_g1_i4:2-862(+)